ncbi:MAG: MucR family transcriptional regulator [Alphaproteobacteria bacterium]|jgi:predicted transcriptional regulator|nr:MucR family transcriptional regulator [Alphaproteobacteria bacterium]MCK5620905.1 MucR family transcriptional regulator [Alphaproteobacteria bacterium]
MAEQKDNSLNPEELLSLTSDIVAAHVSNNTVAVTDLPGLIEQVYKTLSSVGGAGDAAADRPTPAVPIKKSITPDFIICLEDGKKLKMLKRHLKTAYDMTPDDYRERWGLPSDYPMVAPNYAKQRSKLAKAIGLGTQQRKRKKR